MVDATKRNRELVADPPAQCPRLCKPQMVGVGRPPPAQQARLRCHELQVSAIPITSRFAQREGSFIDMPTNGYPGRRATTCRAIIWMRRASSMGRDNQGEN